MRLSADRMRKRISIYRLEEREGRKVEGDEALVLDLADRVKGVLHNARSQIQTTGSASDDVHQAVIVEIDELVEVLG